MTVLIHGGDIYSASEEMGIQADEMLDFSANINPLGIPVSVKEAMMHSLERCQHYPDPLCRKLVSAISAYEKVPGEVILCGNGAADLIYRLARAYQPKKALLLAPTFAEYELALDTVGCECVYYELKAEHGFCIQQDYLDYLTPDLDLIVICNPNNPTGVLGPVHLLRQVMDKCQALGIKCLLDECFNDFLNDSHGHSLVGELKCYEELIILKAFTKLYAIPGVRLGYALTYDLPLIEAMRQEGQCWNVSVIAQEAGVAALGEEAFRMETLHLIQKERQYLKEQLKRLGIKVFDSEANYLFFQTKQGEMLWQQLRKNGILIRSCSNYRTLDQSYFRIAVKQPEDNKKLIQEMERILKDGKTTYDTRHHI